MRAQALRLVVRRFAGKRILIVGDVMLDEFIWGDAHRISPEAPVPVLQVLRRTHVPGGAANTAANVAALGGRVTLGGIVGNDEPAARLANILECTEVSTQGLIVDANRPTTSKTRIIARSQQIVRLDYECPTSMTSDLEDRLIAWVKANISSADACILSDYAKGVVTPRVSQALIELARRHSKPIVVDPKGTDYAKYRGATAIKPNSVDVRSVLGREIGDEGGWKAAGEKLTNMLPGTAVLISRGAEGMMLFRSGKLPVSIPSTARDVFDVTGAGDTVVATFALGLAAAASLEQAAHLANRAAGVAVGKLGTAAVAARELMSRLRPKRPARKASI